MTVCLAYAHSHGTVHQAAGLHRDFERDFESGQSFHPLTIPGPFKVHAVLTVELTVELTVVLTVELTAVASSLIQAQRGGWIGG